MSNSTSAAPFVWFELITPDAAKAREFYGKLFGWSAREIPNPGHPYSTFNVGEVGVAGAIEMPMEAFAAGMRPGWLGYVGVENVDAAAAALTSAGGMVHRAPSDIPGVGRFAVVADPQGAPYMLFTPANKGMARPTLPDKAPGSFAWAELVAVDWSKSFDFYSKLYGWTKGEAMDMGERGTYQILHANDRAFGAMMNRPDPTQTPMWAYYFYVAGIEPAVERFRSGGGQILFGPHEVPGGDRVASGLDPQGGFIGIVAPGA